MLGANGQLARKHDAIFIAEPLLYLSRASRLERLQCRGVAQRGHDGTCHFGNVTAGAANQTLHDRFGKQPASVA